MIVSVVIAADADDFDPIEHTVRRTTHHFRVVGAVPSLGKAVGVLRKAKPRLFLMGLGVPDDRSFAVIRAVNRELPTRVVVMCRRDHAGSAVEALSAGAAGYILTGMAADDVVRLLRAAAA
jgi:DNA-binding NarL/FixJ family response regulator